MIYLPVTLYRRSLRKRSNSICGAITANELNTSIRPNCCSESKTNGSISEQSTFEMKQIHNSLDITQRKPKRVEINEYIHMGILHDKVEHHT